MNAVPPSDSTDKPIEYYSLGRDAIMPLFDPIIGKTVLDVGCGAGAIGRQLKARGCAALHGIECVAKAAAVAKTVYDTVHCCGVEQVDFKQYHEFFDYIICADVLEHLADPWAALQSLRGALKPEGALIASIPNARNREVIGGLLAGRWDYVPAGILDKTHLRFFTFKTIEALFRDSGFAITSIGPNYEVPAEELMPRLKELNVPRDIERLILLTIGEKYTFTDHDLLDLFTIQFLVKAKKNT